MRLSKRLVQASWWEGLVPAHWWVELGLAPWGAGPRQGVCFAGSCLLRKALSSLSADGSGCVPTLLVVWPEACQLWSLPAVEWGQVLMREWHPPGGLMPMSTPQNYHRQCLCPHSEPQLPPPPHLRRRPSSTIK